MTHPGKENRHNPHKDSIIAAAVTFAVALLILLFLFTCGLTFDRAQLAQSSTPEIAAEEDELFIEPEILRDLGEEDATVQDAPAPAFKGEPEQAPEENTKLVTPGKNTKPAPPVEKPVTQKTESPVKATEPSKSEEEKKKVTSAMANKFTSRNGAAEGTSGTQGAGGNGMGISGSVSGRTFKGCPKPSVTLRHKVRVTVNVTIDASGRVISAKARGGADASIRRACEQAALGARWSEKKGAPEAKGTITFTITPR